VRTSLVIDIYERESRLVTALHELGVETERRRLPVGDYSAGLALVKRKSVSDLHAAIIKGRFWPQIGRLTRTARRPYLLVEGGDLDAGPLDAAAVRGALLAVGELGIHVIRSDDPADSALWLKILAGRTRQRRRQGRAYAQRPARTDAAEAMLAAVPGLSTTSAKALLSHFGSVGEVLDAGPEAWLSVRGIGPKRAHALYETLARAHVASSRARSARQGPST
jgi:ERCC4-type nuclease